MCQNKPLSRLIHHNMLQCRPDDKHETGLIWGGNEYLLTQKSMFSIVSSAPGGKVWNLIKPFSGGVTLIRDSLNKQPVPCEREIYTLLTRDIFTSLLLFLLRESVVLETAELFQFHPKATFSSPRSVEMRHMSDIFSINPICILSFPI